MQIEVECVECHTRYRVDSEMGGRVVACHHCHRKFRIPYQARVTHLEGVDLAPTEAEPPRTYQEYGPVAERSRKRLKPAADVEQPFVRLPHLVCELWLPLGVALISYGVSVWIGIEAVMSCANHRAGWTMLAALACVFVLVVLTVVNKVAEAAAATLDMKVTNSIWLQNVAASSLPVLGLCIGLLLGGELPLLGMVCGGLIGGTLIFPYMLCVHQVSPQKAAQFAAMLFLASVIGSGIAGALTTGVLTFVLPSWCMGMPWEAPPQFGKPLAGAAQPSLPAAPAAAPKPTASAEAAKTSPMPPAQPAKLVWKPAVDGAPVPTRGPGRTVALDTAGTLETVDSLPLGSFVAQVERNVCNIIDLGDGGLEGTIEAGLSANGMALSPDGRYLIAATTPPGGPTFGAPPQPAAVWSVANGAQVCRLAPNYLERYRIVGFISGKSFLAVSKGQPSAEVTAIATGNVERRLEVNPNSVAVISPGGRFAACLYRNALRVCDLQEGTVAGEIDLSQVAGAGLELAFSPDGAYLAGRGYAPSQQLFGVGQSSSASPPQLFVWDMSSGQLVWQMLLSAQDARVSTAPLWSPDSDLVLCGTTMVDVPTGKTVATIAAPEANAIPCALLSPYHVLWKCAPTFAGRQLLYKTSILPKAQIDAALASVRGPEWAPAPPQEEQVASTDEPTSQPSTSADSWIVKVMAVSKPDLAAIRAEITAQTAKLPQYEAQLSQARSNADRLVAESRAVRKPAAARASQLNRLTLLANSSVRRAMADLAAQKKRIASLESELTSSDTKRVLTGTLEDGTPVEITVRSRSFAAILDELRPGMRRRFSGSGYVSENVLHISPRSIDDPRAGTP